MRVTVADAARPPIDKACGEGLMPDAVGALGALGVSLAGAECAPFRGIRFLQGDLAVDASFPHGTGYGIRRVALHDLLVDRAAALGVEFLWGRRVTGLSDGAVQLDGDEYRARWIVGADGHHSRIRQWAGLDRYRRETARFGFRRHYRIAPWTDCMELYWGEGYQLYVTPVHAREVCVVSIASDSSLRLDEALRGCPHLAARLAGAEPDGAERGAVSSRRTLRAVYRGNVVLTGDASGSVDAITGDGLCLAFQQAVALAGALERDDLESYQHAHRRIGQRPALMESLMLSLDRERWLRRRFLPAVAARPEMFARLLAAHVGAMSLPRFAFTCLAPLAVSILL
jgi:menaquinone-9 beta-reductase